MERKSFLKSLLTLIVAPSIVKDIEWENKPMYGVDAIYKNLTPLVQINPTTQAPEWAKDYQWGATKNLSSQHHWQMRNPDGSKSLIHFYRTPEQEVRLRIIFPNGEIKDTNANA